MVLVSLLAVESRPVLAQNSLFNYFCREPFNLCPWSFHPKNPIMTPSLPQESSNNIYAPDVHFENGVYKMWYGGQSSDTHDRILYATSSDGVNWSKKGLAVDIGSSYHVNDPSVVKVGGQYYMYYTDNIGGQPPGDTIHLAISTDGVSWTKRGQILGRGASDQWDSDFVSRPSVIYEDGLFKMWYDSCKPVCYVGYATSTDGFSWTKYPNNPVAAGGNAVDVKRVGSGYIMLGSGFHDMPYWTGVSETEWVARGTFLSLSGNSYDSHGQVTPMIFLNEQKEWSAIYFAGASDACWCKNRIGLVYLNPKPFTIQGYKRGCPDQTKVILDGSSTVSSDPYFFTQVAPGPHTIAIELPSGSPDYQISHSVCDCCILHPEESFIPGNPFSFSKNANCDHYDLYWKCSRQYDQCDLDKNGRVDGLDVIYLINRLGQIDGCPQCDLDKNGRVDGLDVILLISRL